MNKLASPSQALPDLPSWTPLRTQEYDERSLASDPGVDELATTRETRSNAQPTAENTVTGRTLNSSSEAKSSERKKARFDGVLIATKPPRYRKINGQTQPERAFAASSARAVSLVDALAHVFYANRHTEEPSPLQASSEHDDTSTGLQTDVETTEAEDERLRLNTRLARNLRRRRTRPNANGTNSENAASLSRPERPVKRLKAIPYEANSAVIDKALGTVQAPISWEAELDIITRDEDFVALAHTAYVASEDLRIAADEAGPPASSAGVDVAAPSARTPEENDSCTPTLARPVLSPYLSRGAKFRQRLDAAFGKNATVRTDRIARPRPADLDLFALPDEYDKEPSPSVSESTESVSSASSPEELASAIPSTCITSQSPDIPPVDTNAIDGLSGEELDAADVSTRYTPDTSEEQMHGWITALQRLIKGKVRVKEEDLEALSIILAEIESVKDSLDQRISINSSLRESVKRLSELYDIPFGDRNKLRQRAENVFRTWPSVG